MPHTKTYSRRLFLTYHELIHGSGKDVDAAVERFAAANGNVDLEQRLTFLQWYAENGRPVEKPVVTVVP